MSGDIAGGPARERYDRARALFLAATRLPSSERDALIERESNGDATLAAEVRALLVSHDDPDESFIAKTALAAAESLVGTPRRIGSYVVRAKIGEGGMGSVFEAVQENPRRVVAVKVLHPSVASESTRHRFEREARLLARLHHPGIAQIFEAGEAETDLGRQPYFVMERVDGVPITEYSNRNGLDTPACLQLFARVCDAVQHAHDRGVVHRDLKPANVLVDASGQPKVLDFGIARLLERDEQHFTSALTGEDLVLGTVPYLSPEQASGRGREIDGRADVYSLGVILYELLTGDLPFDVRERSPAEALRIVLDRDPTPPATRSRALRGDVETIIGKAMEKDRSRRYATAAALASDVRRHLRSEPIAARPPSALYRARKFARRNRALVAGALATFVALAAGGIVAAKFALDERAARDRADWNAYRSSVLLASSALAEGDVVAARSALERTPERHRAFEWRHLVCALDGSLATFDAADEPCFVKALAFSEDGSRLYMGTRGSGVRVVDVGGDARIASRPGAGADVASVAAFGPGAATFLAAGEGPGIVALRRVGSGEILSKLGSHRISFDAGAISPRGDRAVAWTDNMDVELCDTSGPEAKSIGRWSHAGEWRASPAFSPDGSLVAFGGGEGIVRVVDADSGADRLVVHETDRATGLAFSPDGARLAVGFGPDSVSPDAGISVYDLATGALVRRFSFDAGQVCALAFSPNGARLAIGTSNGSVHVVDATTGKQTAWHRSKGDFILALAFSPDATLLAAGTTDGKVALFAADLDLDAVSVLRAHTSYVYGCSISPDGKTIASAAWDCTARLWDAASATEIAVLRGHTDYVRRVEFDPSGSSLVTVSGDRTYRLWDARLGREIVSFSDSPGWLVGATFSRDGRFLVVSSDDLKWLLTAKDVRSGEIRGTAPTPCSGLSVDPSGGFVAAVSPDGSVRIHELPSLALVRSSPATGQGAYCIDYSSDGARLVLAKHNAIEMLDELTLRVMSTTSLSGGEAFVAKFSPDCERVAVGGRDGRLRLIDCRSGEIVANLRGHSDYIFDLAWSPDGSTIVTASGDTTLRIWDTAPTRERLRARLAEERARADLAPRIRALYADLGDVEAVAARLESDSSLSPDERAAALREALRQRP